MANITNQNTKPQDNSEYRKVVREILWDSVIENK